MKDAGKDEVDDMSGQKFKRVMSGCGVLAMALAVMTADPSEEPFGVREAASPVAERHIVQAGSLVEARGQARRAGGVITHELDLSVPVAVDLTEDESERLRAVGAVRVARDTKHSAQDIRRDSMPQQ
jgi:hypothetical protein